MRVGNKKTISRLLPQATAEDLLYEEKVIIKQYIYTVLALISITVFLLTALLKLWIQDLWRMPALIVAAYMGHVDIVQMLLQSKKVDVNQKSSKVNILLL